MDGLTHVDLDDLLGVLYQVVRRTVVVPVQLETLHDAQSWKVSCSRRENTGDFSATYNHEHTGRKNRL